MTKLYLFLLDPGLAIALAVFIIGLAARLILYFLGLNWRLDSVAYKPFFARGMVGGVHSAIKWLIPFGTRGWRTQPFFTLLFFLFHAGAVLVPLFLLGHTEILRMHFGIALPSLPQGLADILTIASLLGLVLILVRRLSLSQVRILTTPYDYFILALVGLPFLTGLLVRMGIGNKETMMLLHLLSGEIMLVLAPFTKLSHIVLYFASRWQLGADFAIKRGGQSRGACFPW